jgi:DNA-binding NarL/FixJ family response regulator
VPVLSFAPEFPWHTKEQVHDIHQNGENLMPDETLTVLIADDHPVFRSGIRALLGGLPDVDIVGEATTGEEAVVLAAELQPDVILMDIKMPGVNGIEATRRIIQQSPHIGIVMLTMFEDDTSVFAAMRAGARGYVLKDMGEDEIVRAIHAVGKGEAIFSPAIAAKLIEFFSSATPGVPQHLFPELSDREREILVLIAHGRKNQEIARTLVLSPKTVRNYVSNIFSKLQVADRTEAIIRARDAGL